MTGCSATRRQDVRRFAWNDLYVPGRLTLRATAGWPARLGVLAMALTLAAFGFVGCSDSGDRDAVQSTTTTESTTTTSAPEETEADEVIAAYEAAEMAGIRAGLLPDPNLPDLAATHTGPMLEQTQEVLRGYQLRHIALRYPDPIESGFQITVDPATVELTEDTAVFDACAIDEGERVNTETGEFESANDGPDTVLLRVGMRLDGGVWKLAERRELESWQGVAGCAA